MKRPTGFDEAGETLTGVLEIAEEQRACLARGDLEAVQALQQKRQELLEGIQSLDKGHRPTRAILAKINRLDRELGCLLLVELAEANDKLKTVRSLKKLLRSRLSDRTPPPGRVSRHV